LGNDHDLLSCQIPIQWSLPFLNSCWCSCVA